MQPYLSTARKLLQKHDVGVFAWCTGAVVLWRVCLELVNQAIVPFIYRTSAVLPTGHSLAAQTSTSLAIGLKRWIQYDGFWYKFIIERGYVIQNHLHGPETIAFFPLFPEIVRFLIYMFHGTIDKTGEAFNLLLLIGTCYFLYKMAELMAGSNKKINGKLAAKIAVLLLLLNPAALFFASLYADALLIFCTTASFYFAVKKSFIWAAVFAGLASGCKGIGAEIAPILAIMYIQEHWQGFKKIKDAVFVRHILDLVIITLLSLSGLLVYMAYLFHRFGNPFLFVKIEKYWARSPSLSFYHHIWGQGYAHLFPIKSLDNLSLYHLYLSFIPVMLLCSVFYVCIKQRRRAVWLATYCILAILIPLSTSQMASLNRYVLGLTPLMAFFGIEYVDKTKRYLRALLQGWLGVSATLLFIFTASFLAGYFVG